MPDGVPGSRAYIPAPFLLPIASNGDPTPRSAVPSPLRSHGLADVVVAVEVSDAADGADSALLPPLGMICGPR